MQLSNLSYSTAERGRPRGALVGAYCRPVGRASRSPGEAGVDDVLPVHGWACSEEEPGPGIRKGLEREVSVEREGH